MDNFEMLKELNKQFKELSSLEEQRLEKKQLLFSKQKELSFLKSKLSALEKRAINAENSKYEREINRRKKTIEMFFGIFIASFLSVPLFIGVAFSNSYLICLKNIFWFISGSFLISTTYYFGKSYIEESRRPKIDYIDLSQQEIKINQDIKKLEKEIIFIKSALFSIEDNIKKIENQNNNILNYQKSIENNYTEIESNKFHR